MSMHTVAKVWGEEQWIVNTAAYCGKRLFLRKGYHCSLHRHLVKDETFYVQSGVMYLDHGENSKQLATRIMGPGDIQRIEPNTWHRFTGMTDCVFFEFSTHHDDADVERMEPSGMSEYATV